MHTITRHLFYWESDLVAITLGFYGEGIKLKLDNTSFLNWFPVVTPCRSTATDAVITITHGYLMPAVIGVNDINGRERKYLHQYFHKQLLLYFFGFCFSCFFKCNINIDK